MLAIGAAGGDAAVAPPSTCQFVRNVPGCLWFGLLVKFWAIRMFAGGVGAGVLVPACIGKAVDGGTGAGVAAAASMRGCCPG